MIVWDCDAADTASQFADDLPRQARVSPFVFDKRCNAIASKGIKNAYDEALLEPYAITKSDSDGRCCPASSTGAGKGNSGTTS